jgi:indoleacetamide hydrolase
MHDNDHRQHDTLGGASRNATDSSTRSAAASDGRALLELSAVAAVRGMVRGDFTAERYAEALLARCASTASLNAFITLEPQRVLEAAREADRRRAAGGVLGPLHGLPIPIKDNINTLDYPTTIGTPALRHFRPAADAPLVATLRAAGAIVLGKTNLHELSYGWTSDNQAFGAVRNPFDPTRIPGGSSGGTAAAVAARMAPLGIAADTEGSIRVPAALCGIVGFRPTTGRYAVTGAAPISSLFDQIGPHARCVDDIDLFDTVVMGNVAPLSQHTLRGVRLAVCRGYFFQGLEAEVERRSAEALARLAVAGAEIVEINLEGLAGLIGRITAQVQDHDIRVELPRYLQMYGAPVSFDEVVARASPDIRATFEQQVLLGCPRFVSDAEYRAIVEEHLPALRKLFHDGFAATGASAVIFPTTLISAPAIGEDKEVTIGRSRVPFPVAIARNISPGSTAGLPGLVLPAGLTAGGMPVSLEIDGPSGTDRSLLALGRTIERILGTGARAPD